MGMWIRLGGVLVAPVRTFRSLVLGEKGGFGDVLVLMALVMIGTAPLEVGLVLLGTGRGLGTALSKLVQMYVNFALLPLAVCLGLGLALVGVERLRGRRVSIDGAIAAAAYLWVPVGMLGLLGQGLRSLGLDVAVLPHVPVSFFLREEPAWWAIILRVALSYGWSGWLAWIFWRVLREEARETVPVPRMGAWLLAGWILLSYGLGGAVVGLNYQTLRPIQAGDPATGFELPRANGPGKLALAALSGQQVLLEFWATWCASCISSMPQLDAWASLHPEVRVLAVHAGGSIDEVSRFVADRGWSHITFLVDESERTVAAYRVDTFPMTFVIGRDGRIRDDVVGGASLHWLQAQFGGGEPETR